VTVSQSLLEQEKGAAVGGNTTQGGLSSSLLDVTLSPARDRDQLRYGDRRVVGARPSLSAAGNPTASNLISAILI
jgi:hypothetical protein